MKPTFVILVAVIAFAMSLATVQAGCPFNARTEIRSALREQIKMLEQATMGLKKRQELTLESMQLQSMLKDLQRSQSEKSQKKEEVARASIETARVKLSAAARSRAGGLTTVTRVSGGIPTLNSLQLTTSNSTVRRFNAGEPSVSGFSPSSVKRFLHNAEKSRMAAEPAADTAAKQLPLERYMDAVRAQQRRETETMFPATAGSNKSVDQCDQERAAASIRRFHEQRRARKALAGTQ